MSAARKAKRPPYFTTSVDCAVDISPSELEEAGWVYVGDKKGEQPPTTEHVVDVVRRWHDTAHPGPWRWCTEEPCRDLKQEDGAA